MDERHERIIHGSLGTMNAMKIIKIVTTFNAFKQKGC